MVRLWEFGDTAMVFTATRKATARTAPAEQPKRDDKRDDKRADKRENARAAVPQPSAPRPRPTGR